jgi:bacterioferritin
VGEDAIEQHEVDLQLELDAVKRLNAAIELAGLKSDNGTRQLLERILREEEESVDWHEAQLHLVKEVGRAQYLAVQIHSS